MSRPVTNLAVMSLLLVVPDFGAVRVGAQVSLERLQSMERLPKHGAGLLEAALGRLPAPQRSRQQDREPVWEEYGGLSKKTLVLGLGLSVLGALLVYDCATSSCDNGFDFGDDNYQDFTGVMMLGVGIPMSLMALSDVGNTSLRLTPAGRRAQETRRAAREAERERQQGHLRRRLVLRHK